MSRKIKIQLAIVVTLAALALLLTFIRLGDIKTLPAENTSQKVQMVSSHQAGQAILKKKAESSSNWVSVLKLVGAMAVVIGAIYGFLFLLRKMMGKRLSSNRGNRILEVLETTYVGQKKSISLVRFADRAILIGTAENSIAPLAELDAEETSRLMGEARTMKSEAGFKNFLSDAREKYKTLKFRRLAGFRIDENSDTQSI